MKYIVLLIALLMCSPVYGAVWTTQSPDQTATGSSFREDQYGNNGYTEEWWDHYFTGRSTTDATAASFLGPLYQVAVSATASFPNSHPEDSGTLDDGVVMLDSDGRIYTRDQTGVGQWVPSGAFAPYLSSAPVTCDGNVFGAMWVDKDDGLLYNCNDVGWTQVGVALTNTQLRTAGGSNLSGIVEMRASGTGLTVEQGLYSGVNSITYTFSGSSGYLQFQIAGTNTYPATTQYIPVSGETYHEIESVVMDGSVATAIFLSGTLPDSITNSPVLYIEYAALGGGADGLVDLDVDYSVIDATANDNYNTVSASSGSTDGLTDAGRSLYDSMQQTITLSDITTADADKGIDITLRRFGDASTNDIGITKVYLKY